MVRLDSGQVRSGAELHRRSQDLQRVGAPTGGSTVSGWGDDKGPVGAKRRSAEGWSLGRGTVAPPRYGDVGA